MAWGEAGRLVKLLIEDPSSMSAAAVHGWEHPITREAIVMADLFDLQHLAKAKRKPKAYPRPWDPRPKRLGTGRYSTTAMRALLDRNRR